MILAIALLGSGRADTWAETAADIPDDKHQAIVFFGVYTQWYKFAEALPQHTLKICNADSRRVQDFPSVKELFQARLIILSDVSGREFSDSQLKQLKSYVERGGSLLVMGGPFTLGLGGFEENALGEMLPVRLAPFDLKWEKAGKPITASKEHALLKGVSFEQKPLLFWVHDVKPKDAAAVVLVAGDHPVLITGHYGKGAVAVFAGTPMGSPAQGQTPFWVWNDWPKLIANLAAWLESGGGKQ